MAVALVAVDEALEPRVRAIGALFGGPVPGLTELRLGVGVQQGLLLARGEFAAGGRGPLLRALRGDVFGLTGQQAIAMRLSMRDRSQTYGLVSPLEAGVCRELVLTP